MKLNLPSIMFSLLVTSLFWEHRKRKPARHRAPTQAEIEETLTIFRDSYSDLEAKVKASGRDLSSLVSNAAAVVVPGTSATYGEVAQHMVDVLGDIDSRFRSLEVYSVCLTSLVTNPETDRKRIDCILAAKTFRAVLACIEL